MRTRSAPQRCTHSHRVVKPSGAPSAPPPETSSHVELPRSLALSAQYWTDAVPKTDTEKPLREMVTVGTTGELVPGTCPRPSRYVGTTAPPHWPVRLPSPGLDSGLHAVRGYCVGTSLGRKPHAGGGGGVNGFSKYETTCCVKLKVAGLHTVGGLHP